MKLWTSVTVVSVFVFSSLGTMAKADCPPRNATPGDLAIARRAIPVDGYPSSIIGVPLSPLVKFDHENAVRDVTACGLTNGRMPDPNNPRRYQFTADVSWRDVLSVYWPYVTAPNWNQERDRRDSDLT